MVVVMLVVILYWCESCVVLVNLVKLEVIVHGDIGCVGGDGVKLC